MNLIVTVLLACVALCIASPLQIADARIRSPDLTPVLGRGYSTVTGDVTSTCLIVNEKTTATYDYDYYFTEIESEESRSTDLSGKISGSFSYGWVKASIQADHKSSSKTHKTSHHMMATMRMERYYSSVDENTAELNKDAKELINRGDYIGFFQACGPNYIRGIRRAAEITAIFAYETSSKNASSDFNAALKLRVSGIFGIGGGSASSSVHRKVEDHESSKSLTIRIQAHGLGLNMEGASTLVARSMDDFDKVMDFAFKSMQNTDVGLVHGIEVVPWVDNINFQAVADLSTVLAKVDPAGKTTAMGSHIKKLILSLNAEFVASLDSNLRNQMNEMYRYQQCLGLVSNTPTRLNSHWLKNHRIHDLSAGTQLHLGELRRILSAAALADKMVGINEYVHNYFGPCLHKLSQDHEGLAGGTLMSTGWYEILECQQIACNLPGAHWNEGNSTCSLGTVSTEQIGMPTSFQFASSADEFVDQYCMPELGKMDSHYVEGALQITLPSTRPLPTPVPSPSASGAPSATPAPSAPAASATPAATP